MPSHHFQVTAGAEQTMPTIRRMYIRVYIKRKVYLVMVKFEKRSIWTRAHFAFRYKIAKNTQLSGQYIKAHEV